MANPLPAAILPPTDRLRAACVGHPHAKIPWPHRLLHEAADALLAAEREKQELRRVLRAYDAKAFETYGEHEMMRCKLCGGEGWSRVNEEPTFRLKHKDGCPVAEAEALLGRNP